MQRLSANFAVGSLSGIIQVSLLRPLFMAAALLAITANLSGCGKKGPLTLPDENAPVHSTQQDRS